VGAAANQLGCSQQRATCYTAPQLAEGQKKARYPQRTPHAAGEAAKGCQQAKASLPQTPADRA